MVGFEVFIYSLAGVQYRTKRATRGDEQHKEAFWHYQECSRTHTPSFVTTRQTSWQGLTKWLSGKFRNIDSTLSSPYLASMKTAAPPKYPLLCPSYGALVQQQQLWRGGRRSSASEAGRKRQAKAPPFQDRV